MLETTRFCSTLVREMADAIYLRRLEGGSASGRPAGAERVFGFSESEALDQSLDIIIRENLRQRHWAGYDETMRTGQTRTVPETVGGPGDSQGQVAYLGRIHHRAVSRRVGSHGGGRRGVAGRTQRSEELKHLRRQILSVEARGASGAPATNSLS